MKIFLLGYPGDMGGANTEAWHTIKIWRQYGIDVHLVPTWGNDNKWEKITTAIGCTTHHVSQETLHKVPDIKGGIVVSFCNDQFLWAIDKVRDLGCRTIWLNCMTSLNTLELNILRDVGCFDAMIYQSNFQRSQIEPVLLEQTRYKPSTGHLIRGAFDFNDWEFSPKPHETDTPFFIGRAARPAPDKWSSNTWPIYNRIQYPHIQAIMLGMDKRIHQKLGTAPEWANCFQPMAIPTKDYYKMLHCLLPINGGDRENWPRVGLEAFASGVGVVAQDEWGWQEMVIHGETGFLGYRDCELAHWAATMAYDETLRLKIINNAYARLRDELANPKVIFDAWQKVFEQIGEDRERKTKNKGQTTGEKTKTSRRTKASVKASSDRRNPKRIRRRGKAR